MKKRILGRYDGKKHGWFRQFREFLLILLVVVLLFQLVVGVFHVEGSSMYPTLENGALAFYLRVVPSYQRGDIVSVRLPSGEKYVKRIVALPGETVDFRDGQLLVDEEPLEEPYAVGESIPTGSYQSYPCTLSEDQYFVLGDNREESMDSRTFGPVWKSELKGKLIFQLGKIGRNES